MSLFDTGIRPKVDEYLLKKAQEERDYGDYWSASSAGYCMRKVMFDRLKVPRTKEDARKQRVFEAGHIFHEWLQRITKESGLSIAQELELQDEELMIRGHIDDLVLVKYLDRDIELMQESSEEKLVLYDYKTQNSRAFGYQKDRPMSHFHRMQLGTYMLMLRRMKGTFVDKPEFDFKTFETLTEGRILKISKDDLRMSEQQLIWSPELEREVVQYWTTLNGYWRDRKIPKCTCADREGGFMARELYNDYFYDGEPCSIKWLLLNVKEKKVNAADWKAERV